MHMYIKTKEKNKVDKELVGNICFGVHKSIAIKTLTVFPREDLAPLMDWSAERSNEKVSRHHSQHSVLLL